MAPSSVISDEDIEPLHKPEWIPVDSWWLVAKANLTKGYLTIAWRARVSLREQRLSQSAVNTYQGRKWFAGAPLLLCSAISDQCAALFDQCTAIERGRPERVSDSCSDHQDQL